MKQDDSPAAMSTAAVRAGFEPLVGEGVVPPIQLSATFVAPGDPVDGDFTYARGGSPAYAPLERGLASLERGQYGIVFNAGVAAANALLDELTVGSVLVMPKDAYYGIRVRAVERMPLRGVEVRLIDQTDLDSLERALPGAGLLWTETPTNPLLAVADLREIGAMAAAARVPWVTDNTFASPVLQRPLEYGALASMESLTKYISGHSDLILGGVATNDSALADRLRMRRSADGTQPDGFSCWLARRGMQTVVLRVMAQSATAHAISDRLSAHPKVVQVNYPGLKNHPGHEIASQQMQGGYGGMFSATILGGAASAEAVVRHCRLWIPATSLGSVESLVERRARWSGEIAEPGLLRFSAGIEDVEDLWADLEQALNRLA